MKLKIFALTAALLLSILGDHAQAQMFGPKFGSSPETCGDVDLRDQIGPIRNQGDVGWCFANAAADLLTFHYRDELQGSQVSADYLAVAYNSSFHWRAPTQEGGYIEVATFEAISRGLCPRSIETDLLKDGVTSSLKGKLAFLTELKTRNDRDGFRSAYEWMRAQELGTKTKKSLLLKVPSLDLESILAESTQKTFLNNFADYFCQGHRVPIKKLPFIFSHHVWLGPKAPDSINTPLQHWGVEQIHRQLDRKNLVSISYFTQFFDLPFETEKIDRGGTHASIIAGRRWHNNRCELLLRNSWGAGCGAYHNPELKGACEAGNVWLPENQLSRYLEAVTYIH